MPKKKWQHMMAAVGQEMKEIHEKLCAEFEVALTNCNILGVTP